MISNHDSDFVKNDTRLLSKGYEIPSQVYADQPYLVEAADGAWVCVITTGPNREGGKGQHITCLRSNDEGKTWSEPIDIESQDAPESSYAVLLKAPASPRLYCFYNFNTQNMRKVKADSPPFGDGFSTRVDTLGDFVYKTSDDNGKSWSEKHTVIPVREFALDRDNPYEGKVRFFWTVGKPFISK